MLESSPSERWSQPGGSIFSPPDTVLCLDASRLAKTRDGYLPQQSRTARVPVVAFVTPDSKLAQGVSRLLETGTIDIPRTA
jgi:hypothetical protein